MIPIPAGWRAARVEDSLLIEAPEGAIRYVERARPLRRVVDLVREHRAPAGFVATRMHPPERLVTAEGEYGAFVVVEGRIGERPVDRVFAFVFGDDCYARLAGLCLEPSARERFRATVRALACADAHMLGARRRRFLYAPPPGWQGVLDGFVATWCPTSQPGRTRILVGAAAPAAPGLRDDLVRAALGGPPPAARAVPGRLAGLRWTVRRPDGGARTFVLLEDERYLYPLRLESELLALDAHETFARVIGSVEPLPAPRPAPAPGGAAMMHWAD
jgi:hypothetical protein